MTAPDYVTPARELLRWTEAMDRIVEEAKALGLEPEDMQTRALWGLKEWEPRTD